MPRDESVNVQEISRSRLPNTDLIMIIVDLWKGDRDDPAVSVSRYAGMFKIDMAPEEIEIRHSYASSFALSDSDRAIIWKEVEEIKQQDRSAYNFKREYEKLTEEEPGYYYRAGSGKGHRDLYLGFLQAIDRLAEDGQDESAWADVQRYREYQAHMHEK